MVLCTGSIPFGPLHNSSPLYISAAAATTTTSLSPVRLIPIFSHHRIPTRTSSALSDSSHRSSSDHVAMYCAVMFYCHRMYAPFIGTPPPPLPPPPRCTSTPRQFSAAGSALSTISPLGPGTPPGPFPCGG